MPEIIEDLGHFKAGYLQRSQSKNKLRLVLIVKGHRNKLLILAATMCRNVSNGFDIKHTNFMCLSKDFI